MAELTTRERFVRTLTGQEVDRVPFMCIFGGGNHALPTWKKENPGIGEYIDELLGFEGGYRVSVFPMIWSNAGKRCQCDVSF